MRLSLSNKFHIPRIESEKYGRIYPWQIPKIVSGFIRKQELKHLGFQFCKLSEYAIVREWSEFEKYYLPPKELAKEDLILDIGARDGDTAIFYFMNGYRNLKLVEPNTEYHAKLENNIGILLKEGCKIDLVKRNFQIGDLDGAKFLKMDCEGCESEFDYEKLSIPYVVELHDQNKPKASGVYDYIHANGFARNY